MNRLPVRRAIACAAATTTLAFTAAPALAAPTAKPPLPPLQLSESGASGQRAIDLLGAHLPAVAAHHRKTPESLIQQLRSDATLRIDAQGRLYYLDDHLPPARLAAQGRTAAEAPYPLDQTFLLHSRPGAPRTIFLDFDGARLVNTAWNRGAPIDALPYDIDGDTSTFSDEELARIQGIWQRVAEDYAAQNINVTTEQPPPEKLTRNGLADQEYGTTVLITHNAGVYNCQCGGVAYVGVFDDTSDYYKPALVFWNMLGNGDEKYVAEAASHEAGHNLGLYHDGYPGGGYYPGHGSGATGWAPIMGVGYYQSLVQWSKGEYAGANNLEDDFAVMAANGGPLADDDHGNTRATATQLAATPRGTQLRLSGSGVIERDDDIDVFSFNAGAGEATLRVRFPSASPNLDVRLDVRQANGALLQKKNPRNALRATATVDLPQAGTYYVFVRGVGKGTAPYADDGYSAYGSRGRYTVGGDVPAP